VFSWYNFFYRLGGALGGNEALVKICPEIAHKYFVFFFYRIGENTLVNIFPENYGNIYEGADQTYYFYF
jgi:hypothetical protein